MAEAAPVVATPPVAPAAPETATPATPAPPAAPAPRTAAPVVDAVKKERALHQERTAWKAKQAAQEKEWGAKVTRAQEVDAALANAKKNPVEALKLLGVTYEELTEAQLRDGKPGPDLAVRALEEKLAKFEADAAKKEQDREAAAKEAQSQSEKQLLARWHDTTAKWVLANADKYELVAALGYQHEVGKMIEEHYDATGVQLPEAEVAAKLEKHLQDQQEPAVKDVFEKLTKTKWFQSRYAPVAAPKAETAPAAPPRRSSAPAVDEKKVIETAAPTITNKLTASSPSISRTAAAKTRDEIRALAIKSAGL